MKINKIILKNFLSHQQTVLDLTNVHAATLIGNNGSGKTSLIIDSLAWCLFGKTRSGDIDQLVQIGKTDFAVEIHFDLGGTQYQIIRKRSLKTKRGRTELFFNCANGSGWQPVAQGSITEVDHAIQQLLKLDYASFLACMVASEGSNAYFADCDPAERKRLVYNILGLDKYSDYAKRARKLADSIDLAQSLDAIDALEKRIAQENLLKQEIREARAKLQHADDKIVQLEQLLDSTRQKLTRVNIALEAKQAEYAQIEEKQKALQTAQATLAERMREQQTHRNVIVQRDAIMQADLQYRCLLAEREQLETAIEHKEEHIQAIGAQCEQAEAIYRACLSKEQELEFKHNQITIEIESLERRRQDLLKQSAILNQVPCDKALQSSCPAITNAKEATDILNELSDLIKARKRALQRAQKAINDCKNDIQEKLEALNSCKRPLDELKCDLRTYRTKLDEKRKEIAALEELVSLKPRLEVAIARLQQLDQEINHLQEQINSLQSACDVTQLQKVLNDLAQQQTQWNALIKDTESQLTAKREERETIQINLALQERTLNEIEAAKAQLNDMRQELAALQHKQQTYLILEDAFKTIPILILEHAKPIIEREANQILARIGTGMQISLPTMKARKTVDKVAETFDIVVRDLIGERPYRAFSSGERARIDLAIRIGLSRLLMLRAGIKIETLILDEGFGMLDANGIISIKECLRQLQDEFRLLLVVSHLTEMQDLFPTQINIRKPGAYSILAT
jgi:exonuclease SbcC